MKKHLLIATLIAAAAGFVTAQVASPGRVPIGQIAGQLVGQINFDAERNARFAVYYTAITGVPTEALFNGTEQSEKTAKVTVVSAPLKVDLTRVGAVLQGRAIPVNSDAVRYSVYINDVPSNRDLSRTETFENGRLVATFRSRNVSISAIPLMTAEGQGVLELEKSEDFFLGGVRVNLSQMGEAVRIHLYGGPTPAGRSDAPELAFAVSGYGVAVNGAPRQ
ncbi:MAG: hypothetical protein U0Q16_14820 [Bryobacteraceae bacterium]